MIPPVNVSGVFVLAPPWSTDIAPGTVYTCIAVREFPDILKKGEDPYVLYYAPKGLTETDYANDYNANEAIVTLRSAGGQFIYVPSSRIVSYPNQSGLAYTGIALAIRLGPIPNSLDLSAVMQKIADDVQAVFGVRPEIQKVAYTETVQKSAADAAALEAARQAAITERQTDRQKLLTMQAQYQALLQQYNQLEAYYLANPPPQT